MTSLNRAFALAEMNRRPVRVGENLKLDVARIAKIALEQHAIVAEGRERFPLRALERFAEAGERLDDPHAAAAAAGARLDQQRKADAMRLRLQRCVGLIVAVVSGDRRHVEGARRGVWLRSCFPSPPSLRASARRRSARHRATARANGARSERNPYPGCSASAFIASAAAMIASALRYESAAGAGPTQRASSMNCKMERVRVGFGVDAERNDPHLAGRASDAHGDLAAIGDQQPLQYPTLA